MAAHGDHGHVTPLKQYYAVFLALMVLTAITTWVAFQDLGFLNNVVALGIAGIKATMVILIFMHVRHSTRVIPVVVLSSLFWLALLLVVTWTDYYSRGWLGVVGR